MLKIHLISKQLPPNGKILETLTPEELTQALAAAIAKNETTQLSLPKLPKLKPVDFMTQNDTRPLPELLTKGVQPPSINMIEIHKSPKLPDFSKLKKIDITPLPRLKRFLLPNNITLCEFASTTSGEKGNAVKAETGIGDLIQEEVLRDASSRSREYESTLAAMSSEGTWSYLSDKTIPVQARNHRLREHLANCLLEVNHISPRLSEDNLIYYAKLINRAKMDDKETDCSSNLSFASQVNLASHTFFGVACHEFEHIELLEELSHISAERFSCHTSTSTQEFICDLSSLNFLYHMTQDNPELKEQWPNDYLQCIQQNKNFVSLARKYRFSFDQHHIARGIMFNMFEQFEKLGISKEQLTPIAYKCSKEVIEDYKSKLIKRRRTDFTVFLEELSKKLEHHFKVKVEIQREDTSEIKKETIKQFKDELLATNKLTEDQAKVIRKALEDEKPLVLPLPSISIRAAA